MSRVTHWLKLSNVAKIETILFRMQKKNYQKAKFLSKWSKKKKNNNNNTTTTNNNNNNNNINKKQTKYLGGVDW